jgi:hypothetical protein
MTYQTVTVIGDSLWSGLFRTSPFEFEVSTVLDPAMNFRLRSSSEWCYTEPIQSGDDEMVIAFPEGWPNHEVIVDADRNGPSLPWLNLNSEN